MKLTTPARVLSFLFFLLISLTLMTSCAEEAPPMLVYPDKVINLEPAAAADLAQKIRQEVAVTLAEGLDLSVWASDSLVSDPIAISIAPDGRIFYTRASRQSDSEFDLRGHRNWTVNSVSFQSVEDRRKFLRENFAAESEESKRFLKDLNGDGIRDWQDLAVTKEQIWYVQDSLGTGLADHARMYIEDFHEEITDVANGVEFANGEVFIGVGPDLWRTKDRDKNGIADQTESISHGYAIHVGFSGHGMSGVTLGPDGRIYWGIGDIGMNVVDKEGKNWKYPNQGVIVRSEPDGTNFEVFAAGVRNTHEFTFDEYGNLITVDNDGDHRGERERLVHLINGSDSGWRTNWQFGKYTDPDNNRYKVWMDEQMSVPRWDGQAAYFLPPIQNYVNGPTGLVRNPGTALGEQWYNYFFVAEFRGSPANSPIHAFKLKQNGAGFALDTTLEVVHGLLPTGLDFGPDGALYFGDWIDGWGVKNEGRIWKLDVPGGANTAIRQETKQLIEADFAEKDGGELGDLLQHQDMRVRVKAQHELAKRGKKGAKVLLAAAQQTDHQLARVHGIWGLNQLARQKIGFAEKLMEFLHDADAEIVAQAAKMLGDVHYAEAGAELVPLLKHESPRVRLYATEALGRIAYQPGVEPILAMLEENNDQDAWLRHAGMIALGRIGESAPLEALTSNPSRALRIAAVVGLRRMKSPGVAKFLQDQDEYVVTEAARAINDDFSIVEALPDLARLLKDTRFTNEALIRRAINANLRVGESENLEILVEYATRTSAPAAMRAEAIATLGTWAKPSVFDRVDGRYRGEITRDEAPAKEAMKPILDDLLKATDADVQVAAAKAAAKLGSPANAPTLLELLKTNTSEEVRAASLEGLFNMKSDLLPQALEIARADQSEGVRSIALEIIPESGLEEEKAVELLASILKIGTLEEKQAALRALGAIKGEKAATALRQPLVQLMAGALPKEIHLDIIDAVEQQGNAALLEKLQKYQDAKDKTDELAMYREALYGGDREAGEDLFYQHAAAQCVRCHSIFETGGNAGPGLSGVGSRLSRAEILQSMIAPSAVYAAGYGVVTLELVDSTTTAGIVLEETPEILKIKIGKEDIQTIEKSQIVARENIPSSMPAMGEILTKRELRDLVAFLSGLKEQHN